MQDVITALQADPQDPNLVHVFIDGRHAIAVALDVAADERLTVGQACPPDRLERLHRAQERQQAFELALNFLSYRPRSARIVQCGACRAISCGSRQPAGTTMTAPPRTSEATLRAITKRVMRRSARATSNDGAEVIATMTRQSAAPIEMFAWPLGSAGTSAARPANDGT